MAFTGFYYVVDRCGSGQIRKLHHQGRVVARPGDAAGRHHRRLRQDLRPGRRRAQPPVLLPFAQRQGGRSVVPSFT